MTCLKYICTIIVGIEAVLIKIRARAQRGKEEDLAVWKVTRLTGRSARRKLELSSAGFMLQLSSLICCLHVVVYLPREWRGINYLFFFPRILDALYLGFCEPEEPSLSGLTSS